MRRPIADNEKIEGERLLAVLEIFRTLRPTMPLQYVVTFLLVALDEGHSVAEYARKLGVSASVMSRHLLDIGERNRHMEEGFGLVTFRKNPENERESKYYLTDKGRAIYQQIRRALGAYGGLMARGPERSWELIATDTHRLRVPSGWLYSAWSLGGADDNAPTIVFVPDPPAKERR